jgi:SRSO17 transposase
LRTFLEQQNLSYALAVPSIEVVAVQSKDGSQLADIGRQAQLVKPQDWQRLSPSLGSKGEHLFDWARLPVLHQGSVDGRHWLVFRRCLDDPGQLSFSLVFAPARTPLSLMVQASGARWRIEEDLQASKDLGLDHYEVRSYVGCYRHLTLVLPAYAFLVGLCVQARAQAQPPTPTPMALIALSPSEVHHLLARLCWPPPSSAFLICHWSAWRRGHQYRASYFHRRRRAQASSPPLR